MELSTFKLFHPLILINSQILVRFQLRIVSSTSTKHGSNLFHLAHNPWHSGLFEMLLGLWWHMWMCLLVLDAHFWNFG